MFKRITDWFKGLQCKKASVTEVHDLLLSPAKENIGFIDVRRGDEWNMGYIEGFTHIALVDLPLHAHQLLSYAQIYFISRDGRRSEEACAIMHEAGYENAFSVSGGVLAWHKKRYAMIRQLASKG
jgi:rhodanese-related sulfurtransferase